MTKLAADRIKTGLREAIALVRGEADPATARFHVRGREVRVERTPAGEVLATCPSVPGVSIRGNSLPEVLTLTGEAIDAAQP